MPSFRSSREPVYQVDAAWHHMDSPTTSVIITGCYLFDRPLDFARVRATLECRLLRFPRFIERVKEPLIPFTTPTWEVDPGFDLDTHLRCVALPAPADMNTLMKLVEDLMRVPLPPDRPLWQMVFVERFGSGSALIARLSHAIADGFALLRVVKGTTDDCPDAPVDKEPAEEVEFGEPSFVVDSLVNALDTVDRAVDRSRSLVKGGLDLARHPSRLRGVARLGAAGSLALGKLLFLPPDHSTSLKGRCGVAERALVSEPLKLKDLKAIGKTLGATVNDVLLSCVTAGFRCYLEAKGEHASAVRAMVPVYLKDPKRAMESNSSSGNDFGLIYLSLPVGIEDSLERLKAVHENMVSIKHSLEAPVAYGILYGMGQMPKMVAKPIATIFGIKGTAVITNVPGPQERLYFAGGAIERMMFWVPHPAGLAVGVSIMSYYGEVTVGVSTDAQVIPDPELILAGFQADYYELQGLAEQVRG